VTVIYGDRDSVVPPELSARVADEAPTLVERVVIRGANHNDEVLFGPPVAGRGCSARESSRVTALESRRRVGGLPKLILPMMLPLWSRPYGR
jgi:hypothetical protein